jgi:hypothetical protein
VDARQHAQLVRRLVAACGGVDEIVRENACRLRATRLYLLQDPKSATFMGADVIADLEAYCGEPIYSQAIAHARPHSPDHQGATVEACELTEEAAEIQEIVRTAVAGGLSPNAARRIEALLCALERRAAGLRAAVEGGDA